MDARTDAAARLALLADATDASVVRAIYDEWAPTYDDEDVAALLGQPSPERVAERLAALVGPDTDVLDAACGTGRVGTALAARGFRSVDGLDLSPVMVRRARRLRVYHDVGPADLRDDVPGAAEKFGAVTCGGGLAPGHLGPAALAGFLRVLRPGGVVVAAIAEDTWRLGYARAVDRLVADGRARLVAGGDAPDDDAPDDDAPDDDAPDDDGPGRLLVLEAREVPRPGRSVARTS